MHIPLPTLLLATTLATTAQWAHAAIGHGVPGTPANAQLLERAEQQQHPVHSPHAHAHVHGHGHGHAHGHGDKHAHVRVPKHKRKHQDRDIIASLLKVRDPAGGGAAGAPMQTPTAAGPGQGHAPAAAPPAAPAPAANAANANAGGTKHGHHHQHAGPAAGAGPGVGAGAGAAPQAPPAAAGGHAHDNNNIANDKNSNNKDGASSSSSSSSSSAAAAPAAAAAGAGAAGAAAGAGAGAAGAANAGGMNAAQFAKIKSAVQECTPYSNAAVAGFVGQFPKVWEVADIMPSDAQANAVWNKIKSSGIIPSTIKPKGTQDGNRQGVTYDATADPDCDWTASKCVQPKHPNIPADIYTCPEPETWGLTYDDGPNCSDVKFMDFLQAHNQKASLYYIGSNVLDWPLQAQRGVADGHHVSAHTWSHKYMTSLSDTQVFAELYYTVKAILYTTGVTVTQWRPPYGDVDDRVRAIATGLGLQTVVWSDDTLDWQIQPQGPKPTSVIEANYNSILAKATSTPLKQGGIIVLSHEINGDTIKQAMKEYPRIAKAFKHVVPVSACQNNTKPYQENILFPDFAKYVSGQVMPKGLPSIGTIQAKVATYNVGGKIAAGVGAGSSSTGANGTSGSGTFDAQSAAAPKAVVRFGAAAATATLALGAGAALLAGAVAQLL